MRVRNIPEEDIHTLVIELEGGRLVTIKQVGPSDISIEGNGDQLLVFPRAVNKIDVRTLGLPRSAEISKNPPRNGCTCRCHEPEHYTIMHVAPCC